MEPSKNFLSRINSQSFNSAANVTKKRPIPVFRIDDLTLNPKIALKALLVDRCHFSTEVMLYSFFDSFSILFYFLCFGAPLHIASQLRCLFPVMGTACIAISLIISIATASNYELINGYWIFINEINHSAIQNIQAVRYEKA